MQNYTQVDNWLKQHPESTHSDFKADHPESEISYWSFLRRRKALSSGKISSSEKPTRSYTRTASMVYTTPWQISMEDIEKKSKMEVLQDFVAQLNIQFKLHLQLTEVTLVSANNKKVLEVRRYNR